MTDEEMAQIQKWQSTSEGKAELAIHSLCITADDLTDALKTRDGARAIRLNWQHIADAMTKLNDIAFEIDNTWRQAAE